jgi:hypothetical protein
VGQYGAQACAAEARRARFTTRKRTSLEGAIALIDWWNKRASYAVIAWIDLMAQQGLVAWDDFLRCFRVVFIAQVYYARSVSMPLMIDRI